DHKASKSSLWTAGDSYSDENAHLHSRDKTAESIFAAGFQLPASDADHLYQDDKSHPVVDAHQRRAAPAIPVSLYPDIGILQVGARNVHTTRLALAPLPTQGRPGSNY